MCLAALYQNKLNPAKSNRISVLHKSGQSGVCVWWGDALTSWCLQAQRSAHSGLEHSSWVNSLLLALQSLQVWLTSTSTNLHWQVYPNDKKNIMDGVHLFSILCCKSFRGNW
jgi:hypothetical protein